jgi:hypothetical protein
MFQIYFGRARLSFAVSVLPIPCDDSPFTARFAPFVGNLFGYCLLPNILE